MFEREYFEICHKQSKIKNILLAFVETRAHEVVPNFPFHQKLKFVQRNIEFQTVNLWKQFSHRSIQRYSNLTCQVQSNINTNMIIHIIIPLKTFYLSRIFKHNSNTIFERIANPQFIPNLAAETGFLNFKGCALRYPS